MHALGSALSYAYVSGMLRIILSQISQAVLVSSAAA